MASGERITLTGRIIYVVLLPFSWIYALIQRIRALMYQGGGCKVYRLPRPVISVGNITVGGTGKTPITAWIARFLIERGYRVAVLSRGYGGSLEGKGSAIVSDGSRLLLSAEQCGDEPYLLASTIPGLMVVVGSDRYAAGIMTLERLHPEVFLLDDGYQHLRLHRDLNLLLLDAQRPFGNGSTLPSGLLREPVAACERADLVISTRCLAGRYIVPVVPHKPHVTASIAPLEFVSLADRTPMVPEQMSGMRYFAFAGIAEPESFFSALVAQGVSVAATASFPDHVVYDDQRVAELIGRIAISGVTGVITTEKDGVKLQRHVSRLPAATYLARMSFQLISSEVLEQALLNLLQKRL